MKSQDRSIIYNKMVKFIPENRLDMFEIDDVEGIREHPLFFPKIDGVEKVYKNRPNLTARLEGSGGGKSLVFSGHIDVMPAYGKKWEVFEDPFSGKIKDGRLYGRGAADMKAGTMSGFLALKCLHDLGIRLKGDVFAESVVDEENGGVNGTIAARLRNPQIDFGIVPEPTNLIVGIESVGGSDWKISLREKGAGGIEASESLENPIYKLSKIALSLEKYDKK
jgi:acetylornithine deacetylase